jgi:hypothetical protein
VWVHFKFSSFPDESIHVSGFGREKFCVLLFNNVVMVNAMFHYWWFVGLCQSYMSVVLFASGLDGSTALSNINHAAFTWDAVYAWCS